MNLSRRAALVFPTVLLAAAFAADNARVVSQADDLLPTVPEGFKVQLFAREPFVRNPCAMVFDARGRLFVGQGPQYRHPKPDTPADTIVMLTDADGDGVAETAKTFATGLNCVQGLAWHGRDLWVANSPDLTILRDLDGDDVADEYVRVYTDLGNIEHALHGLNWAPDGKLYLSQGTSKGLTQPPDRVAPKPFRDLWGVTAPAGTPDLPPSRTFTRDTYKSTYQDPKDDWGREGGVLRCDELGANLEIVSRGMRNPWDIAFDSEFNWLGTDNDQYDGDRIVMPFMGAHFGWAHSWSADWTGARHLPTVPVSGPVFTGSGTGILYHDSPQMPPAYRGVWFINDWLRKTVFVYRPEWDGALLQPKGGKWEPFAVGRTALFQPVDSAQGPDGALYLNGWGRSYGSVFKDGQQINEGRVFRIAWSAAPAPSWHTAKRTKPMAQWTFTELVADLGSHLPIWNVNAQRELVRRGDGVRAELCALAEKGNLPRAQETWVLWTIGQLGRQQRAIDDWFATKGHTLSPNARIQSLRIAAHRIREYQRPASLPVFAVDALRASEPRVRFAAVQAVGQARQKQLLEPLRTLVAQETDRITFYSAWHALRELAPRAELQKWLADARAGVRRAALLALLEDDALEREAVTKLVNDADAQTAGVAALWLAKQSGNSLIIMNPAPRDFTDELRIKLLAGIKPAAIRWTTDGREPAPPAGNEPAREGDSVTITATTTLKVALFVKEKAEGRPARYKKIGGTFEGTWTKTGTSAPAAPIVLAPPTSPLLAADVLPLIDKVLNAAETRAIASGKFDPKDDPELDRGKRVFTAAGCVACHRVGVEGQTFGPDLSAMGDRADAKHIVESMLQPNAIIAEGFALQTVATRDGKSFAGVFKEETNRTLTLVQSDGQPVGIEKAAIVQRESVHRSVMPPYDQIMSAAQMADVAAWLLAQRTQASEKTLSVQELTGAKSGR